MLNSFAKTYLARVRPASFASVLRICYIEATDSAVSLINGVHFVLGGNVRHSQIASSKMLSDYTIQMQIPAGYNSRQYSRHTRVLRRDTVP